MAQLGKVNGYPGATNPEAVFLAAGVLWRDDYAARDFICTRH